MSSNITNHAMYSLEDKRRLSKKISENRNKDELRKIKAIIFEDNPDLPTNKDSGGMLLFFQDLNPRTYARLDKFFKENELKKIKKQTDLLAQTSDKLMLDLSSEQPIGIDKLALKYSNKEKTLMRRKEYDDIRSNADTSKACAVTELAAHKNSIFIKESLSPTNINETMNFVKNNTASNNDSCLLQGSPKKTKPKKCTKNKAK